MADKPKYTRQYIAATAATLGGFALGNVIGWSSPALELVKSSTKASDNELAWMGAIMPLGAATSQISTALLLDRIGRKWLMIIMAFPFALAWCILAFAPNLLFIYLGRFLCGFCGGTFCVAAPTFTGELAEKTIRGRLGVMFQFLLTIGILVTFILGEFKNMIMLSLPLVIFPIAAAVIIFFMPESPVFLYKVGKIDKAKIALQKYRGKDFDIEPELKEIDQYTKVGDEKFWEKFKTKSTLKAFGMLMGMHVIQQLSGINIVMFFAHKIFKMAGASLSPGANAMILGAVQVFVTGISAYLVDKLGRKLLWIISLIVMCACLVVLGFYFLIKQINEDTAKTIAFIPILAVCVYLVGFSLGAGPLPWAMIGELLPSRVKGPLGSTAAFVNWMLAFVVTQSFQILLDVFGAHIVFWFYGGVCGAGIPFILLFTIETKGKTLDEIQVELSG